MLVPVYRDTRLHESVMFLNRMIPNRLIRFSDMRMFLNPTIPRGIIRFSDIYTFTRRTDVIRLRIFAKIAHCDDIYDSKNIYHSSLITAQCVTVPQHVTVPQRMILHTRPRAGRSASPRAWAHGFTTTQRGGYVPHRRPCDRASTCDSSHEALCRPERVPTGVGTWVYHHTA